MGSGPCSEGSRSNGNSAPAASSPSKRSAASTVRRRSACSRRSVVLSSVVTQVGLPVRAPLPAGARGVARNPNPAMKEGGPMAGRLDQSFVRLYPVYGYNRSSPSQAPFIAGVDVALQSAGRNPLALFEGEPATAVGAHVLDQRDEGSALVRELVGHARRHLVEGAALDDPLLLERPEPQRERARADAVERALELAEPESVIRQVTDDEESPLAGDDLRRPADGAFTVHHPARIAARLYFVKRVIRARGSEAGGLGAGHAPHLEHLHVVGLAVRPIDQIRALAGIEAEQLAGVDAGEAGPLAADAGDVLGDQEDGLRATDRADIGEHGLVGRGQELEGLDVVHRRGRGPGLADLNVGLPPEVHRLGGAGDLPGRLAASPTSAAGAAAACAAAACAAATHARAAGRGAGERLPER